MLIKSTHKGNLRDEKIARRGCTHKVPGKAVQERAHWRTGHWRTEEIANSVREHKGALC
jgi:hypothetical protein